MSAPSSRRRQPPPKPEFDTAEAMRAPLDAGGHASTAVAARARLRGA
jgi:hypothetical protein